MGEVKEEAMTEPGWGKRACCCLESDLESDCQQPLHLQEWWRENEPFPHAVNLQINPPDTRHAQDTPEGRLLAQRANRKPLENEEVADDDEDEEREAEAEEEESQGRLQAEGLGWDGQKGRNARAWRSQFLDFGKIR
jgi:hypothetical protein